MTYFAFLTLLGLESRLDIHAATLSGSCTVTFDDSVDVTLEVVYLPSAGAGGHGYSTLGSSDTRTGWPEQLLLYTSLGQVIDSHREMLFGKLLQLHLFGIATGQGTFGYDEALSRILFFTYVPLSEGTSESCSAALAVFLEHTRRWRDALPSLREA